MISRLPLAEADFESGTSTSTEVSSATPWIRRRKNLAIVLGATAGVGLVTAGIAWGLHSTHAETSTPVGVVPATGQTPTDTGGGLVSGDKPADPQPATGPQFAPDSDSLAPPPAMPPTPALPPMPPDPYANDPALKAPAPGTPAASQTGADGLPPDNLSDDLGDPSQSGTGLDNPSYGPPGAGQPQYRPPPRRSGPSGYRGPDRTNGPLGSLSEHNDDNRNGGPRRGPVDDAVPGLGGLSH